MVKNKVLRHVNISPAPPLSTLKWVREWQEWDVEGSAEWKERTSKWWKRERSRTVALANVFPGCSHSTQTPDLWCCSWQTIAERKKKERKIEEPSLAISRTVWSLWGNKQWARTGSHSVSTSENCRDAYASMTVLRKLRCGEICEILWIENLEDKTIPHWWEMMWGELNIKYPVENKDTLKV